MSVRPSSDTDHGLGEPRLIGTVFLEIEQRFDHVQIDRTDRVADAAVHDIPGSWIVAAALDDHQIGARICCPRSSDWNEQQSSRYQQMPRRQSLQNAPSPHIEDLANSSSGNVGTYRMARIAVGGFGEESNSFNPEFMSYDYFAAHRDRPPLVHGDDLFRWLDVSPFPITTVIHELRAEHELLPLVWANGGAGGNVSANAFERIVGEMIGHLSRAMPVDAVFLDLHGAMVSEDFEDAEGEILRRVRTVVGNDVPIVVALDYHANLTPEMVEYSDSLLLFLTYPHVDRPETGVKAARVVRELLQRGRPKGRAFRKLPFLLPITAQCTLVEPSKSVVASSRLLDGPVVCLSYAAGFPYSDIHWAGPAVSVHAHTQEEADRAADGMEAQLLAAEASFDVPLYSPEECVRRAMDIATRATRPVVIADVQDNPGGGGTADTTGVAKALLAAGATDAVLGMVYDPITAAAAHSAGEGAEVRLSLGGRSGPEGVTPLETTFKVVKLGSGSVKANGKVAGGNTLALGPMALLRVGGLDIVVASRRMQGHDHAPFEHLGVDLRSRKIIVVKSSVHFRAEFEPIAEEVLLVAAPGLVPERIEALPFKNLRDGVRLRPMGEAHARKRPSN